MTPPGCRLVSLWLVLLAGCEGGGEAAPEEPLPSNPNHITYRIVSEPPGAGIFVSNLRDSGYAPMPGTSEPLLKTPSGVTVKWDVRQGDFFHVVVRWSDGRESQPQTVRRLQPSTTLKFLKPAAPAKPATAVVEDARTDEDR